MEHRWRSWHKVRAAWRPVALAFVLACRAFAGPAELLEEARGHFDFGEYRTARDLASRAIAAGTLTGETLRAAHVLIGQCELELGNDTTAQAAFCAAWRADPDWNPGKESYREAETEAIERARQDCAPTKTPSKQTPTETPKQTPKTAPDQGLDPTKQESAKPSTSPANQGTVEPRDTKSDRVEIRGKAWYKRPIAWVGGLAVAAGAFVLIGGSGDGASTDPGNGGDDPLDDFPAPPDPPGAAP